MVDGTSIESWDKAWDRYFSFLTEPARYRSIVMSLFGESFLPKGHKHGTDHVYLSEVPSVLIKILNDPGIKSNPALIDNQRLGAALANIEQEFGQQTLESITAETGIYLDKGVGDTSERSRPSPLGSSGSLERGPQASIGGVGQHYPGSAEVPVFPSGRNFLTAEALRERQGEVGRRLDEGSLTKHRGEADRWRDASSRLANSETQGKLGRVVDRASGRVQPTQPGESPVAGFDGGSDTGESSGDEDIGEISYQVAKKMFGQGYEFRRQAQEYLGRAAKAGHKEANEVIEIYGSALTIMAEGKGTRKENKDAIALLQSIQDKIDVSPEIELCGRLERAKYLSFKAGKAGDPAEKEKLQGEAVGTLKDILAKEPEFRGARLLLEKYESEQ